MKLYQAHIMFIAVLTVFASYAAENFVWVEGEMANCREVVPNTGLDAVDTEELSGGAWLSSFANGSQPTGTAAFDVALPSAGTYRLWARGTGELACRLNEGAWLTAAPGKYTDHTLIAADGNPGYPTIGWFELGSLEMRAGSQRVEWRLGSEAGGKRFGALDCFVLSTEEFRPNGKWTPGKSPSVADAFARGTCWNFSPEKDDFSKDSLLDLRFLNEKIAGEHGFVRLSQDGESFLRGDGQPLRFWAAGLRTTYVDLPLDDMRRRMRFLAKRGVNLVRVFAMLPPTQPGAAAADVNERELDTVFRLVAACREAGIYTVICGYWGPHTKRQPGWNLMDSGRDDLGGLLYFDPRTQEAYRSWMRALLNRPNPHTGLRLADDPSVAMVQLQNEDNLLWWDFAKTQGEALRTLRLRYAEFLKEKYGNLDRAVAAWQNYPAEFPKDDMPGGLPGFLHVWDLTRDGTDTKTALPGFNVRSSDQLEFIARLMRRFNEQTIAWLREELGLKALINSGNWQTVDMTATMDAQYWADSAGEVMSRNAYTGGAHFGINNGWQILAGHVYEDKSMLHDPGALPTNVRQMSGHPFILSEVLWSLPSLYQAESAIVMAGQQSLTGLDAGCWFSNFPEEWSAGGNAKWTFSTPMQIGMFPAAALIHRQGLLKTGVCSVVDHRTLASVWSRATPMTSEDPGFDPNRHTGIPKSAMAAVDNLGSLAYLVGGVRVVLDSSPAKSSVVDFKKYIDQKAQEVRSVTGETEIDYGAGVYRINAPMAQGAVGFLAGAGPQKLNDVEIVCKAPYAAVIAVAMDGQPIRSSERVLVQIGTVARPTGWQTRPARIQRKGRWISCNRIVSLGGKPWQVGNIDGSLYIANPHLKDAVALDANGMPLDLPVEVGHSKDGITLTLPDSTFYVLLRSHGTQRDGEHTK